MPEIPANAEWPANLPRYREPFSPQEAATINASCRVVICGVVHGNTERGHDENILPWPPEYWEVAKAVSYLDPVRGDKLFIEGYGFNSAITGSINALYGLSGLELEMEAHRRASLRRISTIEYGAMLCIARGVPVFLADIDSEREKAVVAATGEPSEQMCERSSMYNSYYECMRETDAAYILGREALRQPLARHRVATDRPVYMQLIGVRHVLEERPAGGNVEHAFRWMGLNPSTFVLPLFRGDIDHIRAALEREDAALAAGKVITPLVLAA